MTRLFLLTVILFAALGVQAQHDEQGLMQAATLADSMFWNVYNGCDLSAMMALTAHDIEFFHDKGALPGAIPHLKFLSASLNLQNEIIVEKVHKVLAPPFAIDELNTRTITKKENYQNKNE
ncbi:MAG: hypothetical protein QM640_03630 [Niabella sp.]